VSEYWSMRRLGLGAEEGESGAVEIGTGFDVGDVGGGDFGVGCVGDTLLEEVTVGGRSARIVSARDHKRGDFDGGKVLAKVEIAYCGAVGDIAFGICGFEHLLGGGNLLWLACTERRGEPALNDGRGDALHAFLLNASDAGIPAVGGADSCSGAAEDEFVDASGEVRGELHAGHAAHGETAEVHAVERKDVEQMNDVTAELRDGVGTGRDGGFAVAARVVAENAELLSEVGELCIPHAEIGAERIGEEKDRSAGGPVELVAELSVGKFGE